MFLSLQPGTSTNEFLDILCCVMIIAAFASFVFKVWTIALFLYLASTLSLMLNLFLFRRRFLSSKETRIQTLETAVSTLKAQSFRTVRKISGVLVMFYLSLSIFVLWSFLTVSSFRILVNVNPVGLPALCVLIFLLAMGTYRFLKGVKSRKALERVKDLVIVVAASSYILFFFHPVDFVFGFWLLTSIIPVFIVGKITRNGRLRTISNYLKSVALVSLCALLVSACLLLVFPISPFYDAGFLSFNWNVNEGNVSCWKANNASAYSRVYATGIYFSTDNDSIAMYYSMLNESLDSTLMWTRKAQEQFNECRTYLEKKWYWFPVTTDLILNVDLRLAILSLFEADASFCRTYAQIVYWNNKTLLDDLSYCRDCSHSILTQIEDMLSKRSALGHLLVINIDLDHLKEEEHAMWELMLEDAHRR